MNTREEIASRPLMSPLASGALFVIAFALFTFLGRQLSSVFMPVIGAGFLCYLIVPLVRLLHRRGVPRGVGYVSVFTILVLSCWFFAYLVSSGYEHFHARMDEYEVNLESSLGTLSRVAAFFGLIGQNEQLSMEAVLRGLPNLLGARLFSDVSSLLLGLVSGLTLTAFFLVFLLYEAERFDERIHHAFPPRRAARILEVVGEMNRDTHRYLILKVVVSGLSSLILYGVMLAFGLDYAELLALTIFVLNFIPYFGSIIAAILPCGVALVQFPSAMVAFWLLVVITLVEQLVGNVIEPHVQGRRLNLSPVLILLGMSYFGWLWGVIGMIVSVPLLSAIRLVLEQFPRYASLAGLMGEVGLPASRRRPLPQDPVGED